MVSLRLDLPRAPGSVRFWPMTTPGIPTPASAVDDAANFAWRKRKRAIQEAVYGALICASRELKAEAREGLPGRR